MLSAGDDILELQGLTLRIRPSNPGVVREVHYNLLSRTLLLRMEDGLLRPLMNVPEIWQPNVIKSARVLVERNGESVEVWLRFSVEELPAESQGPRSVIYVSVARA